ncbi:2'-5' RNA ligase family protein [Nocardioides daphniae]|uniref:2'-5' RNA ligase family protein n=1 Tax=Nocardioides daphniae TaxID=402297 RepID=A0A4P7U9V7_9ACTN|nr:2'-5' RNA ligase family protein [Nocardioides daphniae]QCC76830.1 hypothetical protein E2C04_05655 [Nocardioides daphniae]GGD16926.1 hypothetical protein GCM10007231_14850 [Nocardioides daphniae]
MPDHALELSFDAESTAAVVAQWEALKSAGLPSQADHRSMTNAPHLTLVAARGVPEAAQAAGRDTVGPLLPTPIVSRGLVLFGQGARVTVAHLVEPSAALARAAAEIRALVPALRHPVWTPHVTLARRVPRGLLPDVLEVLQSTDAPDELICDRLRWWDPDLGTIEDVAVAGFDA